MRILRKYFMSKRKVTFPVNAAFVIVCCKSEPKALKLGCNVPLKNFTMLLICEDPLEADTLSQLHVTHRVGWLFVPEPDTAQLTLPIRRDLHPCGWERVASCLVANAGTVWKMRVCTDTAYVYTRSDRISEAF
jgi:hypothetical protein